MPPKKPNIIMFLADDMRFDATSYAGNQVIKTPSLDALAKDSFVFDNGFVTTSICPSSRASIMTSEYTLNHRVTDFGTALNERSFRKSFYHPMRKEGYYTGFVGKWGIGRRGPANAFDQWYGFNGQGNYFDKSHEGHLTDVQTEQTLEFLKTRDKTKPFLLIVSYKAPHGPFEPQKRLLDLYKDQDNELIAQMGDGEDALKHLPAILQKDFKGKPFNPQPMKEQLRKYYQLIAGMDESVGKVLEWMKADDLMDDTSVIFTSDNGMMLGAHGFWGKWYMFEESIRVPLLIRPSPKYFPELKPTHIKGMALNIDLAPTILAMGNVTAPIGMQGKSLFPLMQNHDTKLREGFFYEFYGMPDIHPCIGYRTERWKFVRYYDMKNNSLYEDCLYDLQTDPGEKNNLITKPEYKEKAVEMIALMNRERDRLRLYKD